MISFNRLIMTLLIFMCFFSFALAETLNYDNDTTKESLELFLKLYNERGISGVAAYLKLNYDEFDKTKNVKDLERCAIIDCCGTIIDGYFSLFTKKMTGKTIEYPYFAHANYIERIDSRYKALGFRIDESIATIDKTWKLASSFIKQKLESKEIVLF